MLGGLWLVITSFFGFLCSAEVILQPKSQVALEGTLVTFTCAGIGSARSTVTTPIDGSTLTIWGTDITEVNGDNGNWNASISNEISNGETISTITFIVKAKVKMNETEIKCTFTTTIVCHSNIAVLYIAHDDLGENKGFKQPKYRTSTDKRSITISWAHAWSHLINKYTLTVLNQTSSTWEEHTNIPSTDTNYELSVNSSQTYCHELIVYVTAYTDIGTAKSGALLTGFPVELENVLDNDVTVEVLQQQNGHIMIVVDINPPSHCSPSQSVTYNYTVYNKESDAAILFGTSISPEFQIDTHQTINNVGDYSLEIVYWDNINPSEKNIVFKNFSTNFTATTADVVVKYVNVTVFNNISTPSKHCNCTTADNIVSGASSLSSSKSSAHTYLLAIVGVEAALLLLAVIVIIVLAVFLVKMCQKIRYFNKLGRKETCNLPVSTNAINVSTTIKRGSNSTQHKQNLPKIMATNPIYEGTAAIYSYLPEAEELKDLERKPKRCLTNVSLEIPPQLPPPRKMSLDSPGIKSDLERLTLSKLFERSADCNSEYVSMRSTNTVARYTTPPTPLMKKVKEDAFEQVKTNDDDEKNYREEKF